MPFINGRPIGQLADIVVLQEKRVPIDQSDQLINGAQQIPPQNTPRLKTRVFVSHHQHKMRDKYVKSKRIDAAVAAIRRGEFSDYAKAATEYKCDCGAVSRRIRGLTKCNRGSPGNRGSLRK